MAKESSVTIYRRFLSGAGFSGLAAGLMMLAEVIFARRLGVSIYGEFNSIIAISTLFSAVIGLGVPQLCAKEIRFALDNNTYIGQELVVAYFVTLVNGFIIIAVLAIFPKIHNNGVLLGVVTLFISLRLLQKRISVGLGNPLAGIFFDEVITSILFLFSAIVFSMVGSRRGFFHNLPTELFFYASVLSVFCFLFYYKKGEHCHLFKWDKNKISFDNVFSVLSRSVHFVPFTISFLASRKIDLLVISYILNSHEVGNYSAAAKLASPILIISTLCNTLVSDKVASLYNKKKYSDLLYYIKRTGLFAILLASPLLFLCIFFPRKFISTIYGQEFVGGSSSLFILVIANSISAAFGPIVSCFSMTNLSLILSRLTVEYLVFMIFICVILSLTFGILGASISMLLGSIYYRIRLTRELKRVLEYA